MPTRSHPESARIIREARQAAGMPKTDNLFALCDILHIRPADLLRADS